MATSIAKSIRNATDAAAARMLFTESDTNRQKDHHGRSTSLQTVAVIAEANLVSTVVLVAMAVLAIIALALMPNSNASRAAISILPVVSQRLAVDNDSARSRLSRVFTLSGQRKQQLTSSLGMMAPLQLHGCV